MNVETFFENFELLTDAPNSVVKLREIVLQLSVRGKLVSQNSNNESASVLLEKVRLEKERLIKKGKIRSGESFERINYEYVSPNGWTWSRLGEFIELISGQHLGQEEQNEKGEGLPYLTGPADFGEINPVATRWTTISKSVAKRNDILITVKGAGVGKTNILGLEEAAIGRQLMAIRPILVEHEYVYRLILSAYKKFQSLSIGSTVPGIGRKDILNFLVNLPPLAEQKRIVEKCDRLLVLCDAIEKRQQQRQASLLKMNEGAISQLLTAQTPDGFQHHWQGICNNFDLLYSIPETIPKLRQAILQLAVQGKLVPQNPNDESVSVLFENIKEEKAKLIKENKIKALKPLPSIKQDETPFALPENWLWVRMQEIFTVITDGNHQAPPQSTSGVPFLVISNVREGCLNFESTRFVSKEFFLSVDNNRKPVEGDILYTVVGSYGIPIVVNTNQPFFVQRHIALLKPSKLLEVNYLKYVLKSDLVFEQATRFATGIAQKTVPLNGLRKMVVPLPPLAEQKRIVAKVDSLFSLCNTLETKLKAARDSSTTLMEVAAKQILVA